MSFTSFEYIITSIDLFNPIFKREMIFEHLFCDNFLSHTHIIFSSSLYCFDFRTNTYFFFVNHGCHISCQQNSCSNNTSLFKRTGELKYVRLLYIYIYTKFILTNYIYTKFILKFFLS